MHTMNPKCLFGHVFVPFPRMYALMRACMPDRVRIEWGVSWSDWSISCPIDLSTRPCAHPRVTAVLLISRFPRSRIYAHGGGGTFGICLATGGCAYARVDRTLVILC